MSCRPRSKPAVVSLLVVRTPPMRNAEAGARTASRKVGSGLQRPAASCTACTTAEAPAMKPDAMADAMDGGIEAAASPAA